MNYYRQLQWQIVIAVYLLVLTAVTEHSSAGANQFSTELDGISFDSDYENGSLGSIERIPEEHGHFRATLFTESGELGDRSYWFRFRMRGVSGRSLTIALDHSENRRPFVRIGSNPWRRMTAMEAPDTQSIVLKFSDDQNDAEIAFFEPLGLQETMLQVDDMVANSSFAVSEIIGRSHQGRNLTMITIDDSRYPVANKQRIWLHSRAHAGEVTSTHSMLGFLQQALADSEIGRRLREHCIIHIVPILNVDGVALGHTRWDSQGLDPERPWCDVDIPVVKALKNEIDRLMASERPIALALNLHSTRGNYQDTFFFKHVAPSVTRKFEQIQQRYIDAFARATPLFDNLSPQTSQLHTCRFIESYFWNNWGDSVMALTHEGHYGTRITDNQFLTGNDYRQLGAAMATALIEFFDLPEATESDLTYQQWVALHFSPAQQANPSLSGWKADADADGIPNGEEYAMQTAPRDSRSRHPAVEFRNGQLLIRHAARAVEAAFETSTDLQIWSRPTTSSGQTNLFENVEIRTTVVASAVDAPHVFLRLVRSD